MTIVFCPVCHREVCRVVTDFVADPNVAGGRREITKIVQGKRTLINLGRGSSVKGFSVTCPVGHKVLLDKYVQPKPLPQMLEWWRPPPWDIDEAVIDTDGRYE